MKKIIFIFVFIFCSLSILAQEAAPKNEASPADTSKSETKFWFIKITETLYFQPTIGIAGFWVDFRSKEYELGFAPGLGYGIKYKPEWWRNNKTANVADKLPFIGIDMFIQAKTVKRTKLVPITNYKVTKDYFSIEPMLCFSFLDWIYAGYGPRILIALNKGGTTKFSHIMTLGLGTSF